MSMPDLKFRLLFVYGTLRRGQGAEYKIVDNGGIYLATGIEARGKRLGVISAKFLNAAKSDRIVGDLVLLPEDNAAIMTILDRYEGISSNNDEKGMYRRVVTDVFLPGHDQALDAWAYHINH